MTVIFIHLYLPFTVDVEYTCNKIEISTWRDYKQQLDLYLDTNISCIWRTYSWFIVNIYDTTGWITLGLNIFFYVGLDTISDNSVLHLVIRSVDRDQHGTWIIQSNCVCCKIVWLLGSVMSFKKDTYYKVTY